MGWTVYSLYAVIEYWLDPNPLNLQWGQLCNFVFAMF